MRYVVNVRLWDAIVGLTLTSGLFNPVLMSIQLALAIWFSWDWIGLADDFVTGTIMGFMGLAFYLVTFQVVLFIISILVCLFSPKMKRGILGEHVFEVREEGLFESTPFNEALHKWPSIDKVRRALSRHFVRVAGTNWFIIPDHSFASREEAVAFANQLRSRMRP